MLRFLDSLVPLVSTLSNKLMGHSVCFQRIFEACNLIFLDIKNIARRRLFAFLLETCASNVYSVVRPHYRVFVCEMVSRLPAYIPHKSHIYVMSSRAQNAFLSHTCNKMDLGIQ